MSSNFFDAETQYLLQSLSIARVAQSKHLHIIQPRGAVLVQQSEIIGSGYDNPKTGDFAELMALKKPKKYTRGATLYVSASLVSTWKETLINPIINSQIQMLVYGYINPRLSIYEEYQENLRKLEEADIRCVYLRIPEILQFYAPYRFAEGNNNN